jgi:hypothetical protein
MKYVTTFRCRDFFIDVSVKPESKDSPILTLYKDDPSKKTEAKIAKPTSNAFAKLKIIEKIQANQSNHNKTRKIRIPLFTREKSLIFLSYNPYPKQSQNRNHRLYLIQRRWNHIVNIKNEWLSSRSSNKIPRSIMFVNFFAKF